MATKPDVRWQQRFNSYGRAFALLQEALQKGPTALNQLEKEGTAQRFRVCLELGWGTMKDYLEYGGVEIVPVTPRQVVKEAFAAGIIQDGAAWIAMLDHRNLLSHTYDEAMFDKAVCAIVESYLGEFELLRSFSKRTYLLNEPAAAYRPGVGTSAHCFPAASGDPLGEAFRLACKGRSPATVGHRPSALG